MNNRFSTRKWMLSALLILPWLVVFFSHFVLIPLFSCLLGFFAILCTFTALAFLFAPLQPPRSTVPLPIRVPETVSPQPQPSERASSLPTIPMTVAEVLSQLNHRDFELFSAAVIVGSEPEHQFAFHTGKKGDRGVDVWLRNAQGLFVIVQSKHYAIHHRVSAREMRELIGTIRAQDVAYGYFVTTSTFTSGAHQEKRSYHFFIRIIDGPRLEILLRNHTEAIARAYADICKRVNDAHSL